MIYSSELDKAYSKRIITPSNKKTEKIMFEVPDCYNHATGKKDAAMVQDKKRLNIGVEKAIIRSTKRCGSV